jgi:hypothetical protein
MAHSHDHSVDVVEHRDGFGSGAIVAVAALIVLAVIGLAVLFAAPWDDDNSGGGTNNPVPGINNPVDNGGDTGGGDTGGGGTDNSGGGEAPAPAQ